MIHQGKFTPDLHTPDLSQLPLAALGIDALEEGLLSPLRHLLTARVAPETQAWYRADLIATENWGPVAGPALVRLLWPVVDALCQTLQNNVFFNDPLDLDMRGLVSRHEALVLEMLHHMRRADTIRARDAVDLLTNGHMDPGLIRAGLSFAHRFACGAQHSASPKPTLRVVKGV